MPVNCFRRRVLFLAPPSYPLPYTTIRLGRVHLRAIAARVDIAISVGFTCSLQQRTRAVLAERITSWSDSLLAAAKEGNVSRQLLLAGTHFL